MVAVTDGSRLHVRSVVAKVHSDGPNHVQRMLLVLEEPWKDAVRYCC